MATGKFSCEAYGKSLKKGELTGSRCEKCGKVSLPPRQICPACHSRDMTPAVFKGAGKIIAFTVISVPPPDMAEEGFSRENPYCCGVVELEEGVRITARITGVDCLKPENIKIGTPVTAEFISCKQGGEDGVVLAFRKLP